MTIREITWTTERFPEQFDPPVICRAEERGYLFEVSGKPLEDKVTLKIYSGNDLVKMDTMLRSRVTSEVFRFLDGDQTRRNPTPSIKVPLKAIYKLLEQGRGT